MQTTTTDVKAREPTRPSRSATIGGMIVGIALGLMIALPIMALGAAVAYRLFCLIVGVCG